MNHTTDPQDAVETARALLWRHGLPEDVIDGALCLHAQELAAVQRRDAAVWGVDTAAGKHILGAADLIDQTRTTPAVSPSAVVSADRATLLREAAVIAESLRQFERCTGPRRAAQTSENVGILRVVDHLRQLAVEADGSRVAAEEQPAETQCSCGGAFPVRHLHADEHRPAVGEQPDTQTREARLVELRVHYRVQLRDNATADWKPSHPSLDYEDREDADESAAMGREYFPSREYRVVTRTTTITEQP